MIILIPVKRCFNDAPWTHEQEFGSGLGGRGGAFIIQPNGRIISRVSIHLSKYTYILLTYIRMILPSVSKYKKHVCILLLACLGKGFRFCEGESQVN